ncbi:condensation domain-containing protein, partial [Roseateles sp. BYS180W]
MSNPLNLSERRAGLTPEQRAKLAARMRGAAAPATAETAIAPRSPSAPAPLSFAQQRQWFLWRLDPTSRANHLSGGLKLSGRLDVAALHRALEALARRHASLRTTFREREDGSAEQVVLASPGVELPLMDLAGQAMDDAALRSACTEPFDLEQGPLWRTRLFKQGDDEHWLLVAMHHIISDAWSTQVILDDLGRLYREEVDGSPADMFTLPIDYRDYAEWQRREVESVEVRRQLEYWRGRLGGVQPVLVVPTDRPRMAKQCAAAAQHDLALPPALTDMLRKQAQASGGTLFMSLLAAFKGLLFRLTGESDLRIGVPIANRLRAETAGLVGFFVNTQVLRGVVDARMSLDRLLEIVRQASFDAQAHQDLPFERLVEALQPERSVNQSPLFQVMFNHLRRDHRSLADWPNLRVRPWDLREWEAQFDLSLETVEAADGTVTATLIYAAELFEPTTIERLGDHYLAMLQALAEHPEQALGEVELAGEAE